MIEQLREKISEANQAYRLGKPLMSDSKYDILIDQLTTLSPNDEIFGKIGIAIADETRKVKLEIEMASMNKLKNIDDVNNWVRLKGINRNELVIMTPKFDGLSLAVKEAVGSATTRGDGTHGQRSNDHYKLIQNHLELSYNPFEFTYGEVMIPKKVFLDKYSMDFANPRNLVAGLLNNKEVTAPLRDCQYIKYGAVSDHSANGGQPHIFKTKKEIIDLLNKGQKEKVNYHICKISELTEELLIGLFHKWATDYEIDGVIIEVNDISIQDRLGRENSSNNPVWARAFKHSSFEQSAETEVIGISWNISKQGLLKPILHIKPVKLDGVTVSNVTGNNARFVKDSGLGVGAIVIVKRSGMVIPIIYDVVKTVPFQMPAIPGVDIDWNENGIELITLTETDDQKLKKLIAFFEILEADNVGEGVISQLWDAGFTSIKDILNLKTKDLEKIDRFGKRKATIVYNSIQKSVKDISLSKLQHATGIFPGLGSKKLILLEHFTTKPTTEQVMSIDGFAETSANTFVDNYDIFNDFIKDLPITLEVKLEVAPVGTDLAGTSFVFTGVRRTDLVDIIESRGGKESTTISKNVTHLICKDKNSNSSKMIKARDLGILVMDVDELELFLQ